MQFMSSATVPYEPVFQQFGSLRPNVSHFIASLKVNFPYQRSLLLHPTSTSNPTPKSKLEPHTLTPTQTSQLHPNSNLIFQPQLQPHSPQSHLKPHTSTRTRNLTQKCFVDNSFLLSTKTYLSTETKFDIFCCRQKFVLSTKSELSTETSCRQNKIVN